MPTIPIHARQTTTRTDFAIWTIVIWFSKNTFVYQKLSKYPFMVRLFKIVALVVIEHLLLGIYFIFIIFLYNKMKCLHSKLNVALQF